MVKQKLARTKKRERERARETRINCNENENGYERKLIDLKLVIRIFLFSFFGSLLCNARVE